MPFNGKRCHRVPIQLCAAGHQLGAMVGADAQNCTPKYVSSVSGPSLRRAGTTRSTLVLGQRLIFSDKQAPEEGDETVHWWKIVWERQQSEQNTEAMAMRIKFPGGTLIAGM